MEGESGSPIVKVSEVVTQKKEQSLNDELSENIHAISGLIKVLGRSSVNIKIDDSSSVSILSNKEDREERRWPLKRLALRCGLPQDSAMIAKIPDGADHALIGINNWEYVVRSVENPNFYYKQKFVNAPFWAEFTVTTAENGTDKSSTYLLVNLHQKGLSLFKTDGSKNFQQQGFRGGEWESVNLGASVGEEEAVMEDQLDASRKIIPALEKAVEEKTGHRPVRRTIAQERSAMMDDTLRDFDEMNKAIERDAEERRKNPKPDEPEPYVERRVKLAVDVHGRHHEIRPDNPLYHKK